MKGKLAAAGVLCLLLLTACADRQAAAPAPAQEPEAASTQESEAAATQEPDSARVLLDVSRVDDVFAELDLSSAELTAYGEETGTYAAGAAIRAGNYLAKLRGYTWEECQVPDGWGGDEAYRCELTAPGVTLTAFQSSVNNVRPFRVLTDGGEGWFTLTFMLDEQADWMVYNTFMNWYSEARAAALYGGEGTPLTAEELDWFQDYTMPGYDETWGGVGEAAAINCFFTSEYDTVNEMNFEEFMRYFPGDDSDNQPVTDLEFEALKRVDSWPFQEVENRDSMPVPIHRYSRSTVDAALTKYAGITTADLDTSAVAYLEEYDAYYNYTSDFGPGFFLPLYGEKNGDLVTLWSNGKVLTLQSVDGGYRILSYQAANG